MEKNTKKQKIKVKLTDEEKERIIEEIFDTGAATKSVNILSNRIKATLISLTPKDYFIIEEKMSNSAVNSKIGILQSYGLWKLVFGIAKYKSKKETDFSPLTAEDRFEFLSKLPSSIIDRLMLEQQIFEAEVKEVMAIENIEQVFFVEGDLQEKPEQSPEE